MSHENEELSSKPATPLLRAQRAKQISRACPLLTIPLKEGFLRRLQGAAPSVSTRINISAQVSRYYSKCCGKRYKVYRVNKVILVEVNVGVEVSTKFRCKYR